MSLHTLQHSLVDSVSSAVRVSGFAWFDMMIATLVSGLLLQHLPVLLKNITSLVWKIARFISRHSFGSTPQYFHTVEITSSSDPTEDKRSQNFYNQNGFIITPPIHSPNTKGPSNLPIILGTLHYFQRIKAHFSSKGDLIGHVQMMGSTKASTREKLMNGILSFIPKESVNYNDMKFTFSSYTNVQQSEGQILDQEVESDSNVNNGKNPGTLQSSSTLHLKIEGDDLSKIEEFLTIRMKEEIDTAYPDPDEDKGKQFMFEIQFIDKINRGGMLSYVRTPYTTSKTFNTVFFEGKERLLQTLSDFKQRKGAWSPQHERPYKLVILLEGLPGTGKTSIIKAVANQTRRQLLLISAASISNDAQLSRLFRDSHLTFSNGGLGGMVSNLVEMNERMYVFEDLDCCGGDWLLEREGKVTENESTVEIEEVVCKVDGIPKRGDKKDINGKNMKKEKKVEGFGSSDHPSLSGFLNILDGVCELNGVIIILTTNKAEVFDKALLRAGRVDIRLTMAYMNLSDLALMLCYYFDATLTEEEKDLISKLTINITASEVQEICQHCTDCMEAIQALMKTQKCH